MDFIPLDKKDLDVPSRVVADQIEEEVMGCMPSTHICIYKHHVNLVSPLSPSGTFSSSFEKR